MATTRTSILTATIAAVLLPGLDAEAAWEAVPTMLLQVEADNNPRLDSIEAKSDMRSVLEGRVRAVNYTERGELTIEPRIQAVKYGDERNDDLENTDLYLVMQGQYAWQKTQLRVFGDVSRTSILSGELLDAAPSDPDAPDIPGTDTGELEFLNQIVTRSFLRPTVNVRMSERTDLVFETQLMDVSYSGVGTNARSNFSDMGVAMGLQHRASPRHTVSARAYVSEYEADVNENSTRNVGVMASFDRQLSETLTFGLNIGLLRTDFQIGGGLQPVSNADTNYTLNFRLRQRLPRSTMNVDVARQVDPNGSGVVVNRESAQFSFMHRITPRLTLDTSLRYTRTRAIGVRADNDRDYLRSVIGVDWSLTERWFLSTGYDFTSQRYVQSVSPRVSSNTVFVGIGFSGLSRR